MSYPWPSCSSERTATKLGSSARRIRVEIPATIRAQDRGQYGDCCPQILQAITGRPFYSEGYLLENTEKARTRREAELWWKQTSVLGEEFYFAGLLEDDSKFGPYYATTPLLRINSARYLPLLLGNLVYWHKRALRWDPKKFEFVGDDEVNSWRDRPRRDPWKNLA